MAKRYKIEFDSEDPHLGDSIHRFLKAYFDVLSHGHNGLELIDAPASTPAEEPVPVPEEEEDPLAGIEDEPPAATREEMMSKLGELKRTKGNEIILKILAKLGVSSLAKIPEDKIESVIATVDKILGND